MKGAKRRGSVTAGAFAVAFALTLAVGPVAAQTDATQPPRDPTTLPWPWTLLPPATPAATTRPAGPGAQPAGATRHPVVPSALVYPAPAAEQIAGLSKIKHIVIILQENRSFDHYFGTFPGAEEIPMKADGKTPVPCLKNPTGGPCVRPYHDKGFLDGGGPHHARDHLQDVNGGKMDGFLRTVWNAPGRFGCQAVGQPHCIPGTILTDVMGYKTKREIPNYWTYAKRFVLQDHMFEPVRSYTLPAHLYMVSAWSAKCDSPYKPMTCRSAVASPEKDDGYRNGRKPIYAWTDITYLLHEQKVSWRYYVGDGTPLDCGDGRGICDVNYARRVTGSNATPMLYSPLNYFTTVQQARQADNIQPHRQFFSDLRRGKLADVVWVTPDHQHSEHAPNDAIDDGQAWVTQVVNSISRSKFWESTAIFVTWDDWGGFYDHVVPPVIDNNGYGIRVPGFLISPYAKQGFIDKQVLSFDSYLKFIEDVFLGGQRLDPATMSRPDSRPTVREDVPLMGDLINEFDFTQAPRPPVILRRYPSR